MAEKGWNITEVMENKGPLMGLKMKQKYKFLRLGSLGFSLQKEIKENSDYYQGGRY